MKKFHLTLLFLISTTIVFAQGYNHYYGNIHAHTGYSDGNKDSITSHISTPIQSFNYAKSSQNFDFLGISEHNHSGAGMKLSSYAKGLAQADAATVNGSFVAMYGMEWGVIANGGHVIIYGYDKLLGWESGHYDEYVSINDYPGLFAKIAAKPGAFAYLAHPTDSDYAGLVGKPWSYSTDHAIVGVAIRSGPAFSTEVNYSDPSFSNFEAYYQKMLSLGYHLAPGIDHDNHNTTFGRTAESRVVALAPSLTRADIIEAFRKRRVYASDDWNARVDFNIDGNVMGSIVYDKKNPVINVKVSDPGELISSIKLYFGKPGSGNLPTLLTSNTGDSTLTFTNFIPNGSSFYYYAVVTEKDGDRIVTAPIWYTFGTVGLEDIAENTSETAFDIFPNPAGKTGSVNFTLKESSIISFDLVSLLGNKISVLKETETLMTGNHKFAFDLDDSLSEGVYLIRMTRNDKTSFKKLVVLH